jgi:hypothetical protein
LEYNGYAICLPKELDPMFKSVFSMVLVSILDFAKDQFYSLVLVPIPTRGVSHCGLAIYIKKYLKEKKEL